MSEPIGRWITLKGGRRVFITEGQSISDVIKEYDKRKKTGKKIKGAYNKKKHLSEERKAILDFKDRKNQQIRESLAVLEPKLKEAQKRMEEVGPWTKRNSGLYLTRELEKNYYESQIDSVGRGFTGVEDRLKIYDKEINNPTRYKRINKKYKDGEVYKRKGVGDDRYKVKEREDGRYELLYGNKYSFSESGNSGNKAEIHNLLSKGAFTKLKSVSKPKSAKMRNPHKKYTKKGRNK